MGEGEYLLNRVRVQEDSKLLDAKDMKKVVRQRPNTRILGVVRFHLGLYNLSGRNGDKRFNQMAAAHRGGAGGVQSLPHGAECGAVVIVSEQQGILPCPGKRYGSFSQEESGGGLPGDLGRGDAGA